MRGVDELTELLESLAADAEAALEYDRLAEERRQRIRRNLPKAREAGAGVAELERTIKSVYVARTISRWTAESAPAERPKRNRKRPGAGPVAS
jgi:hypothetical protein